MSTPCQWTITTVHSPFPFLHVSLPFSHVTWSPARDSTPQSQDKTNAVSRNEEREVLSFSPIAKKPDERKLLFNDATSSAKERLHTTSLLQTKVVKWDDKTFHLPVIPSSEVRIYDALREQEGQQQWATTLIMLTLQFRIPSVLPIADSPSTVDSALV